MGAPKTKKQSFVALDVLAALSVVLGLLFMFVPSWHFALRPSRAQPKSVDSCWVLCSAC
jgi:hypothetical protein